MLEYGSWCGMDEAVKAGCTYNVPRWWSLRLETQVRYSLV